MPTSTLADMALAFRDDLEHQTQASVAAILQGWVTAQERLGLEVDTLLSKIDAARLAGVPMSPAWLYQQNRLAALTDAIGEQIDHWAPLAEREARELAYTAAREASTNAQRLAREAARTGLPGLEASFTDLAPENMASILGHLAPGGPLRDLLHRLGGETSQAAQDVLLQGVLLGKGSAWMKQGLQKALNVPAWRAETIARTEALRAYRETSRQTYIQSNVVGSWTWLATIDRRTCSSCIIMDGTEHPLKETLDDHPRGRCAMVPRTKTWEQILGPDLAKGLEDTRPPVRQGKDWLAQQSPATQAHYLGPAKAKALQAGDITLDDLVARTRSPEWGTMRRERSLVEIREGRNANWTEPVTPDVPPRTPDVPGRRSARDLLDPPAPTPAPTPAPSNTLRMDPDDTHAGLSDDAIRQEYTYLHHRSLMRTRTTEADLSDIMLDTDAPYARRLAARDELEHRFNSSEPDALPLGMPKSKFPDHELVRFQKSLETMEDQTVQAQFRQKDAGVRFLARREMEKRLELRGPAAPSTLAERLNRHRDTMDAPPIGSQAWADDVAAVNKARWELRDRQYQVNCTNATTTWELRRRGFDVTAAPRPTLAGRDIGETPTHWGADLDDWAEPRTLLQAERHILKMGEGSRGAISVVWNSGGGHIFNWEVHNGKVTWVDAQPGWNGDDLRTYLTGRVSGKVHVFRMDHLDLTDVLEDYIRELMTP